jgi:hypothetical protein
MAMDFSITKHYLRIDMAIVRSPRDSANFTVLSNSVLLDKRLSMRALGMLVRLLSRPDNWRTNSETLSREFSCGRDQVRTTLKELSLCGYIRLVKSNDGLGRISSEWHVFDSCSDHCVEPGPEKPQLGYPAPGFPANGTSVALTSTDLQRTDNKRTQPALPVGFAEFWGSWPKSIRKGGKAKCIQIWARKRIEDHSSKVIAHVKLMIDSDDWIKEGGRYIPSPETYLNGMRWDGAEDDISTNSRMDKFKGCL